DATEVLLSITDLSITTSLEADRAQASIDARLDDTGSLQGQLAVAGLSQPSTQLDGSIAATLPSISVIELFTPQLANITGAVDLRASVGGTLDEPQMTGTLRLTDLATDIPEL